MKGKRDINLDTLQYNLTASADPAVIMAKHKKLLRGP